MDATASFAQVALSLALVLGALAALTWITNRLRGASNAGQANVIRVISATSIGPKERLMLVEVADEQLLLGIGAGGIRTLHQLADPVPTEQLTAAAGMGSLFGRLLSQQQQESNP